MSEWLASQLRTAMADGRLAVGSRLPATRVLAAELHVARGVVTEAYQRLVEDGRVLGRGRAGTIVVASPVDVSSDQSWASMAVLPAPPPFFVREPGDDIFDRLRNAPARIDLSPGVPDLAAFPRASWQRAERAVLKVLVPSDFGYGNPAGTLALRRACAIG